MGRRRRMLDALLGRKFKITKFKATVNLAVNRLIILKKQRQARLTVARSDIIQLLNLNHHEHALLRVDQVTKEQNMLDVYVMVDGYCHLLLQMVNLIEKERYCPDELKEAASSLMFAAPRCGELPELQEIRVILTARFGKEFANGAIELRGNCGVNTTMILKLSPRLSSLDTRMKMLEEIAIQNNIVLSFEDSSPVIIEDEDEIEDDFNNGEVENNSSGFVNDLDEFLSISESINGKTKYKNAEDAAQAAFESAAYAAAAARAAVELSRSQSSGSGNPNCPNSPPREVSASNLDESKLQMKYKKKGETELNSESDSDQEGERTKNDSDLDVYMPLEKTTSFYGSRQ